MSSAPLDSSSSYASPLMSVPVADQFSLSIRSTMSRLSLAGSWIRFCALRKMTPRVPGCLPSVSRMCRYVTSRSSPSASRSLCHEQFSGTICSGWSLRVSRSCAIFRNSMYVNCSVYSMVPTPSSRSTLQYDHSLSTKRLASNTSHLLHHLHVNRLPGQATRERCTKQRTSQHFALQLEKMDLISEARSISKVLFGQPCQLLLLIERRDWELDGLESGGRQVRNVGRDPGLLGETTCMHVPAEHQERELRQNAVVRLEPDEGVRESDINWRAGVHGRSAQELRALTLVQEHIARLEAKAVERVVGPMHLLDIAEVDAVLEHVGHSEVRVHVRAVVPVRVPLAPQCHVARFRDRGMVPVNGIRSCIWDEIQQHRLVQNSESEKRRRQQRIRSVEAGDVVFEDVYDPPLFLQLGVVDGHPPHRSLGQLEPRSAVGKAPVVELIQEVEQVSAVDSRPRPKDVGMVVYPRWPRDRVSFRLHGVEELDTILAEKDEWLIEERLVNPADLASRSVIGHGAESFRTL